MINKIVLFVGLLLVAIQVSFAESISASETYSYVGKRKTVCGLVASTKYAYKSRGTPTFLNIDKPYPYHVFTIVIWGNNRDDFDFAPEEEYLYKTICVTGIIKLYKGKTEIIVTNPGQIKAKQ